MTTQEFSEQFDTLLNSYAQRAQQGDQMAFDVTALDEYEKSVFLTKAQEMLVEELYTGKNVDNEAYEETERMRRYLSNLNTEIEYDPIDPSGFYPISEDSQFFQLDDDVMFITYEAVKTDADACFSNRRIRVIPVKQDWFHRQANNPFRGPTNSKALRLDKEGEVVEIVYPLTISKYYIRYIRKPRPIILTPLDNVKINDESNVSECELDKSLHRRILDRAVYLALTSKGLMRESNRE